jgi:hypothetical protein
MWAKPTRAFGCLVPEQDEGRMLKLTQELFGPQDPDAARVRDALSPEQFSPMMAAVVKDFGTYFGKITATGAPIHATTSPLSLPMRKSAAPTCRSMMQPATT